MFLIFAVPFRPLPDRGPFPAILWNRPALPASFDRNRRLVLEFCCKGGVGMKRQHVRLTDPMIREKGSLRMATWEEALDRVVEGFAAARERGPHAFGIF